MPSRTTTRISPATSASWKRTSHTPVRVVWGERDIYIRPDMGAEFAAKAGVKFDVLPGIGHYPHLQDPQRTESEVRASFR